MTTPLSTLPEGSMFAGDYRVMRQIGAGGMGAVYVVTQLSTGRERALKLMLPSLAPSPEQRARFSLEARVGSKIASDHIVEVLAAGIDEASGAPYMVMELLKGQTLQQRLREAGPMPVGEVARVFDQLGHALGAAHAQGVVHRDLKPDNIFLSIPRTRAAGFFVKVLDFGVAKLLGDGSQTQTAQVGTPSYMAPEQVRGEAISAATDVWALGLIAFKLLTGLSYWKASHREEQTVMQLMFEISFEPLVRASERASALGFSGALPPGFDAWFSRCVARNPTLRFPDGGVAARVLVDVLERGEAVGLETLVEDAGGGRAEDRLPETNPVPAPSGAASEPTPRTAPVAASAPRAALPPGPASQKEQTAMSPSAPGAGVAAPGKPEKGALPVVGVVGAVALAGLGALLVHREAPLPGGVVSAAVAPLASPSASASARGAASAAPSSSSSAGEAVLAVTDDLQLWLKADALADVAEGGAVASWADSSGHGRAADQPHAGHRPTLRRGVLNGRPVVRFDGENDFLFTPSFPLFASPSSALTLLVVFRANSVASQRFLLQQPQKNCSNNFEFGYHTGLATTNNMGLHAGCSRAAVTEGRLSSGVWYLAAVEVAGAGDPPENVSFRTNGARQASIKQAAGWPAPGRYGTLSRKLVIAGRDDANNGGYNSFHDGDIAEILIYSSVDPARRQAAEGYLRAKYAL